MKKIIYISLLLLLANGCRKDTPSITPIQDLIELPDHFPKPYYSFDNFELSQAKIDLGKKLFYDPILSSDSSISCASCHNKSYGFSDKGMPFSHGVNDSLSDRNSIGLVNLMWSSSFFYDGGVNHLELTSFAPIVNRKEMNEDIVNVIQKLSNQNEYKTLFNEAFGNQTISAENLLWALTSYMATLISENSKYDQVIKHQSKFTIEEKKGHQLFKNNCAKCHSLPLTTNYTFENNGLDSAFTEDTGRESITKNPNDIGKFKVPSLRNIALTAPYMHDGRFNTLDEVIEHYSSGIKQSETLSPLLTSTFEFSADEKKSLIAFLHAFTDYSIANNPNF